MKKGLTLAAAFALATTAATADEVWTSSIGDIVYLAEIDGTAIFTYPVQPEGSVGWLYFPGLAGNYDNRGQHLGYWIAPGEGACPAKLTGVDGTTSNNWGQLMIVFHSPGFPASWTMVSGNCFDALGSSLTAMPKLAVEADVPPPPPPPPPSN